MRRTLLDDLDKQDLQEQIDSLKESGTGTGADGKSAYEIAVDNGFDGTETEWLDSLKGEKGETGAQGEQGVQGDKGETGAAGEDGVSVTHTWNGTVLTITSASGTSSVDLKGEKGDQGEQGIQGKTGEKGDKGEAGVDGYTPVKGTDYWTEADKSEIVNDVVSKTRIDVVPDYVITEAETVVDLILEKINANCLIGAFISDIHLENNQTATETSILNAAFGIKEIRKIVPLDFVANLGDNCESEASHKFIHKALYNAMLGIDSFWLRGNHEGSAYNYSDAEEYKYLVTDDEVYKFVGVNNKGHSINADDRKGMYGYKDFEDLRLRVIYLNTSEVFDNNISNENPNIVMSTTQIEWLRNSALDFSSKADVAKWKVLILSHAPLDWNTSTQQAVTVLDEYVSSNSGAKIIGNIHGHLHNCNVGTIGTNKIPRFAIPQICADRYNEYSSDGDSYAQWGDFAEDGTTPIYYYKGENNSTDTMFCVVIVDCENEKIYAINFGVTAAVTLDGSYTKNVRVREISFDGSETEEPEATLESISVAYTGGDVAVGTALTDLTGLTVTATYSDGSTAVVTGYTLSGTISEGENTITVSYGGLTTAFTVTGVEEESDVPSYTNYAEPNDTNTTDFTIWCNDARLGSDGTYREAEGVVVTNFISVSKGDVIRMQGINVGEYNQQVANASKENLSSNPIETNTGILSDITYDEKGCKFTVADTYNNGAAFIRFCGTVNTTNSNVIITRNEEIA